MLYEGHLPNDVIGELEEGGPHPRRREDARGKDEEHGGKEAQAKDMKAEEVSVQGREEVVKKLQEPPGQVGRHHHREENGTARFGQ